MGKQPYAVAHADQRLMATAGLSRTLALSGVPPRARPFRPRAHPQHTAAARRRRGVKALVLADAVVQSVQTGRSVTL